ncbi:MAG: Membrane protein [Parcubacteria group bacterium GW2011_GWB1_35_5]|nr:MAG: Membrane protein [Parcubacteria group bacterium GW2011_GWB1_35_5]
MLNPFPELFTYSLFAPFILRLVAFHCQSCKIDFIEIYFKGEKERWQISLATLNIPKPKLAVKIFGGIEMIGGMMLILGFYTQIAALVLGLLVFVEAYVEYKDPAILKRNFVFYSLLLAIVVSLLLSGAGAFAIDLPL